LAPRNPRRATADKKCPSAARQAGNNAPWRPTHHNRTELD